MRFHQWAWVSSALAVPSWRGIGARQLRCLSASAVAFGTRPKPVILPPKPTVNEDDIIENFLKGSGPGGQKIVCTSSSVSLLRRLQLTNIKNKTTSAVQLIHKPTGLVVKSQDTRSRSQNRIIARKRLAEMLDERENGEAARSAIKRELQRKKKNSRAKKSRRKYRKLEEEKKKALEEGRSVAEEEVDEEFDEELDEDEKADVDEDKKATPVVEQAQNAMPEASKSKG